MPNNYSAAKPTRKNLSTHTSARCENKILLMYKEVFPKGIKIASLLQLGL